MLLLISLKKMTSCCMKVATDDDTYTQVRGHESFYVFCFQDNEVESQFDVLLYVLPNFPYLYGVRMSI